MNRPIQLITLLSAAVLCAGCSTTGRQVTYDNTIQVAKRPLSGTATLGWRVKSFWTQETVSFWRRHVTLPLLARKEIPELNSAAEPMPEESMRHWLDETCGPPVAGSVRLLLNGESFFPRFEESIRTATNRIQLKTYLFDNDDVAKEIADLLKARSRDIPVEVLYDSGGTRLSWGTDSPSLPANYVNEAGDMIRYLEQDSAVRLRRAAHTMLTSEHSKFFLIDGRTAFFGGMNIGREYRYDWRDAMFELNGPVLSQLENRFARAWMMASGESLAIFKMPAAPPVAPNGALYLIRTTPFSPDIFRGQLRAIRNAKQHIYIENPYLWNVSIITELCAARKRGVDVRVTVPRDVNHGIGIAANKVTVSKLLNHGVRVFIYPGMTHVKAAVYDQWACFGSANFDDLSLHKNYELNIFTDDPETVKQVRDDLLLEGQRISAEIESADEPDWIDLFTARFAQYL